MTMIRFMQKWQGELTAIAGPLSEMTKADLRRAIADIARFDFETTSLMVDDLLEIDARDAAEALSLLRAILTVADPKMN